MWFDVWNDKGILEEKASSHFTDQYVNLAFDMITFLSCIYFYFDPSSTTTTGIYTILSK